MYGASLVTLKYYIYFLLAIVAMDTLSVSGDLCYNVKSMYMLTHFKLATKVQKVTAANIPWMDIHMAT